MKKKSIAYLCAMILSMGLLCGCGSADAEVNKTDSEAVATEDVIEEDAIEEADVAEETDTVDEATEFDFSTTTVRVASLKGATSIGLVKLWDDAKAGNTAITYDFTMSTAADEILPLLLKGELDIALIPANAAANLYQKSEGKVCVIDINTLGVLYMVSGDSSIDSVDDLKGKTVYLTGKGNTPDYAIKLLLKANDIDLSEVTLEYKSEASEVAAVLANDNEAIGLLPQPFVTAACAQNEALSVVLDINKEWESTHDGKGFITGVTVARKDFVEENKIFIDEFINNHEMSATFVNENVEEAAGLVAESGIIEKAPIAMKAIPNCNITCIYGNDMKDMLSDYLSNLYEEDPEFIGGKLPEDDFYYVGE